MNPLPWTKLSRWYESQCNGEWEHSWGVCIDTLDNPGWRLRIDLDETPLFDVAFHRESVEGGDDEPWYTCWRTASTWEAACSPDMLEGVVDIFLEWVNQH